MSQTNVKCEKCESTVIPRLWHTNDSICTYSFTQHICPICGTVMYETGGEIKTQYKALALAVIAIFAIGALQEGKVTLFLLLSVAFIVTGVLAFPTESGKAVRKVKKIIAK
jgi:ribosomal protein S27E